MFPTITPPPNFGTVNSNIFRCRHPGPVNFPFLNSLRLKSLIYLSKTPPSKNLVSFCKRSEIRMIRMFRKTPSAIINSKSSFSSSTQPPSPYHPTNRQGYSLVQTRNWKPLSDEYVKSVIELMFDKNLYPLILVGTSIHQIGVVIACYRRVLGWSLTSALTEFRLYAQNLNYVFDEQFIEFFDTDLVSI